MSKKTNKFHQQTIKEISKEMSIDERVVDLVATHPLLFLVNVMRDIKDLTPIMLRYLGKFAIVKGRKKK